MKILAKVNLIPSLLPFQVARDGHLNTFDTWAKIQSRYVQYLGNFDQFSRFEYDTDSSGIIQE